MIGQGSMIYLPEQYPWPDLGYAFKKEHWNNGYATEFATAFMQFWWSLPREHTNLEVHPSTVGLQDTQPTASIPRVAERVYASTEQDIKASQGVLEKAGFELFESMGTDSLTYWQNISS